MKLSECNREKMLKLNWLHWNCLNNHFFRTEKVKNCLKTSINRILLYIYTKLNKFNREKLIKLNWLHIKCLNNHFFAFKS